MLLRCLTILAFSLTIGFTAAAPPLSAVLSIGSPWGRANGFVVKGNVLVTNAHVLISLLGEDFLNENGDVPLQAIVARDIQGREFRIKNIQGMDLITDLALLRLENYTGPYLDLGPSIDGEVGEFYVVGFTGRGIFLSEPTIKFTDIDHLFYGFANPLSEDPRGISGSVIVNEKREVLAVIAQANTTELFAIKAEYPRKLLQQTHSQVIEGDEAVFEWINEKIATLKILAREGNVYARYRLGIMTYNGLGVKQDHQAAAHWFSLAAEQGHILAQEKLAFMYFKGMGVSSKVAHWHKKAAERGEASSQFSLGFMYLYGERVRKNRLQGLCWLKKAADQGHLGARRALDLLPLQEKARYVIQALPLSALSLNLANCSAVP